MAEMSMKDGVKLSDAAEVLARVRPSDPEELPDFMTVESRTGTSARAWCADCDYGSNGWVSPREAFDWVYEHVDTRHPKITR